MKKVKKLFKILRKLNKILLKEFTFSNKKFSK